MPSRPENIQLAVGCLQLGIAGPEQIEGYLGDAEAVEIARTLAEKRGAFPTAKAGANEETKARLIGIAAGALAEGLSTPDLLATAFADWPDTEDVVDIAVSLARKRLAAGNRRPPWDRASSPPPAPPMEIDPTTGNIIGPRISALRREPDALTLEEQRRSSLTACSRGAHDYTDPDPFTGWSRCRSCGYTLVVDRRPGPGGLLANADGYVPTPSLPPRPKGNLPWRY